MLRAVRGFTGHIDDDASGLTYMQARYYDPIIGRFLSNDPVPFTPQRLQMFNRYSYTENDPVNFFDPNGADKWTIHVGGAFATLVGGHAMGEFSFDTETLALSGRLSGGATLGPRLKGRIELTKTSSSVTPRASLNAEVKAKAGASATLGVGTKAVRFIAEAWAGLFGGVDTEGRTPLHGDGDSELDARAGSTPSGTERFGGSFDASFSLSATARVGGSMDVSGIAKSLGFDNITINNNGTATAEYKKAGSNLIQRRTEKLPE